jgi:hypothetical protein
VAQLHPYGEGWAYSDGYGWCRPAPTLWKRIVPPDDAASRTALLALIEDLRQTRALAERLAAEVERLRDDYRRMAERISADKVGDFVEPAVIEKAMELADKRCNDRHHTRHWWHLYVPEARAALADARSAGLIPETEGRDPEEVILRQGDPGYWGPPDAETIRRIEEFERASAESAARSAGLIETAPGHTDLMISPEAIDEVIANAPAKEGT